MTPEQRAELVRIAGAGIRFQHTSPITERQRLENEIGNQRQSAARLGTSLTRLEKDVVYQEKRVARANGETFNDTEKSITELRKHLPVFKRALEGARRAVANQIAEIDQHLGAIEDLSAKLAALPVDVPVGALPQYTSAELDRAAAGESL